MLTIVVPTRRRHDFLRRLLQYWASVGGPWPLIIADQGAAGHFTTKPRMLASHDPVADISNADFLPDDGDLDDSDGDAVPADENAGGPVVGSNFDIAGSAFGLNALGGTYANPTM